MQKSIFKIDSKRKYFFLYTALFAPMFFLNIGVWFMRNDSNFIWKVDGLEQHYPFFVYTMKWSKGFFEAIFIKKDFSKIYLYQDSISRIDMTIDNKKFYCCKFDYSGYKKTYGLFESLFKIS